jgi:predicted negative regulator of RcsB-dependent stress response
MAMRVNANEKGVWIMAKWAKIVLVVSLVLNVGLIIGYAYYTSYARAQIFKCAAMSAEVEADV